MWVKICGITREEDALAAVEAGADAIGIVLTKSTRRAAPDLVESWIHTVEGIEKVGVFTDEDPGAIESVSLRLGLDTVQVHAPLVPGHRMLLRSFGVISACRDFIPDRAPRDFPCRILIDASMGTGAAGIWMPCGIPFILAGGLTPENVRQAISEAGPLGVDVSSGVEVSPGIKDADKVRRFIREAKS